MDDFALGGNNKERLSLVTAEVVELMKKIGFTVNLEKSRLTPSKELEYLGVILMKDTLKISKEKVKLIEDQAGEFLKTQAFTTLRSFCGRLQFIANFVERLR